MFKVKKALIRIIKIYQKVLSPDRGFLGLLFGAKPHCVMVPSCSEYMILSLEKYGIFKGISKGILRIFRCHPFQKKLIDYP